jgi:hypothetical protein
VLLRHVSFGDLQGWHIKGIAASLNAAPEAVRIAPEEIVDGLRSGSSRLFEWSNGLLVVREERGRLHLDAIYTRFFQPKAKLVDAIRALAAHYRCDTIQTTCFDKRMADVIVGLGGQVESWTLTMPLELEQDHGR